MVGFQIDPAVFELLLETLISSARVVFFIKSSARVLISALFTARALPLHNFWWPHYIRQLKMATVCETSLNWEKYFLFWWRFRLDFKKHFIETYSISTEDTVVIRFVWYFLKISSNRHEIGWSRSRTSDAMCFENSCFEKLTALGGKNN